MAYKICFNWHRKRYFIFESKKEFLKIHGNTFKFDSVKLEFNRPVLNCSNMLVPTNTKINYCKEVKENDALNK